MSRSAKISDLNVPLWKKAGGKRLPDGERQVQSKADALGVSVLQGKMDMGSQEAIDKFVAEAAVTVWKQYRVNMVNLFWHPRAAARRVGHGSWMHLKIFKDHFGCTFSVFRSCVQYILCRRSRPTWLALSTRRACCRRFKKYSKKWSKTLSLDSRICAKEALFDVV